MEKLLMKLLKQIIQQTTPELRTKMVKAVEDLEKEAEKNGDPWDEILVLLLKVIMDLHE